MILTVVSCKIYEINIGGNTENAIVTEESVGKEQQKDIEETIEIQEETESFVEETEEPCYEDQVLVEEIEDQYLVYDHYHEIADAEKWDMPYADQETFEIIQSAYEEVDFFGEFEKGNLEVYDEPESVKLIVFICQSTIRLAKSKKCTLIMLNQSA